jgi:hypothetical protein
MSHKALLALFILALSALACGANFALPQPATPGPDQTDQISVSLSGGGQTRLTVSFGAGDLTLAPGAVNLVQGTATYNVPDLKPQIRTQGNAIEIKQGDLSTLPYPAGIKNTWDLELGGAPMDLTINAGAYRGEFELGGLSLTGLTVKDGAASVNLSFTRPNLSEMPLLRYETGASTVKLHGLANANFSTMIFNSGAGDYTLDFSGRLKRSATVTISTGLSNLILVIPDGVAANVTVESGASNVNAGAGWTQNGSAYSQSGSGPTLTFVVKTGAGNLTLTH